MRFRSRRTAFGTSFHPNGVWLACGGIDWLATSGADGAVTIWDTDARDRIATFVGGALALAFDPAGKRLAVAAPESALYIYDVTSRQTLHEIEVMSVSEASSRATAFAPMRSMSSPRPSSEISIRI